MRVGPGRMVVCGLVLSATTTLAQPAPTPPPAPTGSFPDGPDAPPKTTAEPAAPPETTAPPASVAPPPPELPKPAPATSASAAPVQKAKASPPTPPPRRYDWDLGAGIGFGGDDSLQGISFLAPISASTPSFRLALERRIAGGLWLTLNGSFVFTSAEGPPANATDATPDDVKRTFLSTGGVVGVRQAMTSGIVETSFSLGFGVGYASIGGDEEEPEAVNGFAGVGSSALTYGFVGGLSVERELIEALAVRLSANVVSLAWSNEHIVPEDGGPKEHTKSTTFEVDLVPFIDLRFYF